MTDAPETETDANGLTEAEKDVLHVVHAGGVWDDLYAAVERIVAERVRVVEGERDALRFDRDAAVASWRSACGRADLHLARAESAEAAHEAEKAAHERLRAGVEALADEWAEDYPGPNAACNRTPDEWATGLRSLLGGGEAR